MCPSSSRIAPSSRELPILQTSKPAQWKRVSYMEFDRATLIMDRFNGKWATIPPALTPVAQILATDTRHLSGSIQAKKDQLASELESLGLTRDVPQQSEGLTTLIVKLTNACNYACTYCYDREEEDKATHLSPATAVTAIKQALVLAAEKLTVVLHGGEPTLRFPQIKQIVLESEQTATKLGKRVVFCGQTNLSCLTQEIVDFSIEHAISWGLSLDGPPDLNDRFRVLHSGAGTYNHFEKALEQFPSFVRSCGVMSTVTSVTDKHLLRIARHFRDLRLSHWDWSLFQPIGRGRNTSDTLEFSVDDVVDSWNRLFDAILDGEFDGFPVMPVMKYLDNFFNGPGGNMCMRKQCGAARDLLSISANNTIEACDCIDPASNLSNLGVFNKSDEDSLQAARESNTAKDIRSRNVELGKCSTCIWLSVCGGTCLAHAGKLHGVWEAQCILAMNAFTRIAESVTESNKLREYRISCKGSKNA
jgi:uncharacterized protein